MPRRIPTQNQAPQLPWAEVPMKCKWGTSSESIIDPEMERCKYVAIAQVTVRNAGMFFTVPLCTLHQRIYNKRKADERRSKFYTSTDSDA